jgi:tRNA threonylcarbamoyl adenosine modification protein (Sua5/YciO/YrdC/YwlC family)
VTVVLDATGEPPPPASIAAAVRALRDGDVVGMPTDTVYGLAADPWHSGAADRLFLVKGRPRRVELPVLVANEGQALDLTTAVPDCARRLMNRFWPGALTIVLPRREDVTADLGDEDETIGLRCPDHPVPLAVCRVLGPIATSSANRHGAEPVTTAAALAASLPGVALVLDAGPCDRPASTVVDATGEVPKLLRQGSISWPDIMSAASSRPAL